MAITAGNKKLLIFSEFPAAPFLRVRIEEETAPGCLPKRLVDIIIKREDLARELANAEPLI